MSRPDENRKRWQSSANAYKKLIADPELDSEYLRKNGVIKNLVDLIGDCSKAAVLDAGCGPGDLLKKIRPALAYECDFAPPETKRKHELFSFQDVRELGYIDQAFDVVIASFLLIWIEDIDVACKELHRVTKSGGGKLIVVLPHPYFYRTGEVVDDERFLVTVDLSQPFSVKNHKIGAEVGPLIYHYRLLSDYLNTLIRSGWQINRVREWFIDMDDYRRQNRKTKLPRTGRVPCYKFIECVKP